MWRPQSTFGALQPVQKDPADPVEFKRNRTNETLVPSEYNPQSLNIQDHEGNNVNLAWCPKYYDEDPPRKLPPFPFQVYLTGNAKKALDDPAAFAERFTCFIEWIGGVDDNTGDVPLSTCIDPACCGFDGRGFAHYRFEVYSKPFTNALACIAHQRKEILHRGRNGIWPRIVPDWTDEDTDGTINEYNGKIIIIDRDDWEKAGVLLAWFDNGMYDDPSRNSDWNIAGDGDRNMVQARRAGSKDYLRVQLRTWWIHAGCKWVEADLERRNAGGFSPALYPAVDPASHLDAEHEEVHELDGMAVSGPVVQSLADQAITGDRIIDMFDKEELFQREKDLPYLRSESYSDSFGLPVTSVWNPKLSTLRPAFSMTLFVAFDALPVESKTLFSCLNKGLISRESWTLDVVRNIPSLDAAYEYHSRASARRHSLRILKTDSCMKMLISKIMEDKLPPELLEYIRELLVPPEIPDYSSRSTRPFRNVFLYLDAKSLQTGPWLVYSNPAAFELNAGALHPTSEAPAWFYSHPTAYAFEGTLLQARLLQVVNLRYWHRVADEIHVLWSFCGPRIEGTSDEIPVVSLNLELPEELLWEDLIAAMKNVHFELHSSQPITVHSRSAFSHYWDTMFEIVDVDTGIVLPPLPHEQCDSSPCFDSWSKAPELGLHGHQVTMTISPVTSDNALEYKLPHFEQSWESMSPEQDSLVEGRQYALRLAPHVTIPRWKYEERDGPYNLPPIRVNISTGSQCVFRYSGDRALQYLRDQARNSYMPQAHGTSFE